MTENIHTRLKQARSSAGFKSARDFALQNGLVENTYRSHENGGRGVKQHDLEKYAKLLDVEIEWLIAGKGRGLSRRHTILDDAVRPNPKSHAVSEGYSLGDAGYDGSHFAKKSPIWGKIAVLGYASGSGEKTAINWEHDAPVDWVDPLPGLAGVSKAAALMILGDSMEPRYRAGEIIFVNRAVPPRAGQDCVIDTKSGETHIKQFVRQDHDTVYFLQFNPQKEFSLKKAEIIGLYAVVGRL